MKRERKDVFLSSATDPYQPVEAEHQITRRCLEVLARKDWPLGVLTRNPLVRRDTLLLKRFTEVSVGMSVPTLDEEARRLIEPGAPPIEGRLRTLRQLADEGLATYANLMPAFPLTGGHSPDDVARAFRDAGVRAVHAGAWRYLDTVVPVLQKRLAGTSREDIVRTVQEPGYYARMLRSLERAFARVRVPLHVVYPEPNRGAAPMDWGERE
jgi:DNA repair photolyase